MDAQVELAGFRGQRPVSRGYASGRFGQIHFREARPADASRYRPLVLLHQNPSSSLEYERLMEEMAVDRTVIALDTPGYGMSDPPPEPLSMSDYAACLLEAAEDLGLLGPEGCDVYGFHTGALLAIEFALAAPERVHRVVVSGIPMRSPSEREERLNSARNAPALDEAGETVLHLAERLWDFIVRQRASGVQLDRAAAIWVEKLRPLDRLSWAYHGVWSYDFEARLPLVRQPLLLLQPHEDIYADSVAAAALVKHATVIEMPEFKRDLFELPAAIEQIAAEMRQFLDRGI